MLVNMLTTYLAASLVPLAAAVAVPQQTYDFVRIHRLVCESRLAICLDLTYHNPTDRCRWWHGRRGVRNASQPAFDGFFGSHH